MRTQKEESLLQARKRCLTRNQLCWHLDLGLPASRTVRNKFLWFKSPQSMVFGYPGQADYHHHAMPSSCHPSSLLPFTAKPVEMCILHFLSFHTFINPLTSEGDTSPEKKKVSVGSHRPTLCQDRIGLSNGENKCGTNSSLITA